MATPNKKPGIKCAECGCTPDYGERCDCEKRKAENASLERQAKTRRIIAHNMKMMAEAQAEWEYR